MKLGIDIGNSYATIATLDNHGKTIFLKDVSSKKDYEIFTPLKVQVDGQFAFLGQTVNSLLNSKYKLNVGKNFFQAIGNEKWQYVDDNRRIWTPENLLALLFKKLKLDAESSGTALVTGIVATFPGYFKESQKEIFTRAINKSGLNLDYLIPDYKAVLEGYGFSKEDSEERNFLVFDLGKTHFNTSIVRCGNNKIEPINLSPRYDLGGQDFDHKILEMILDELRKVEGLNIEKELSDSSSLNKIAELIKVKLSSRFSTLASEVIPVNNELIKIVLTKQAFHKNIESLLARLVDLVNKSLLAANLTVADINHVLLVGGAAKMVFIQEELKNMFGSENNKVICESPRKVIVKGAAIYAYSDTIGDDLANKVVDEENRLGYDISILLEDKLTGHSEVHSYFTKETILPDSKTYSFKTAYVKQKIIRFQIIKNKSLGDLLEVLGIIEVTVPLESDIPMIELTVNVDTVGEYSFNLVNKQTGEKINFHHTSDISPVPRKIKVGRRKIKVVPRGKTTKVVVKPKSKKVSAINNVKIMIKPKDKSKKTLDISAKPAQKSPKKKAMDWKSIIDEMVINNI